MARKPHHSGSYHVQARKVRDWANANPDTARCWRCNRLAHQHPPGKWTAGHVIDGQAGGPLAPEWSSCNYAAGARRGNGMRHQAIAGRW